MSQRLKKLANAGKQGKYRPTQPTQPDLAWDDEPADGGADDDAGGKKVAPVDRFREFDWHGEYSELCSRFPWRVAAYIAWASSPRKLRKPTTQQGLAEALGLKSDRTVRKWLEDEPTIAAEVRKLQASPLVNHRRDIYEALVSGALDVERGHQDRKLALELMGDYKAPKRPDDGQLNLFFNADDAATAEKEVEAFEQELGADEQQPDTA